MGRKPSSSLRRTSAHKTQQPIWMISWWTKMSITQTSWKQYKYIHIMSNGNDIAETDAESPDVHNYESEKIKALTRLRLRSLVRAFIFYSHNHWVVKSILANRNRHGLTAWNTYTDLEPSLIAHVIRYKIHAIIIPTQQTYSYNYHVTI